MPRYYFDKNDKSCKTFLYGGCDGNRNNFLTERDCFAACGDNQTIVVNQTTVVDGMILKILVCCLIKVNKLQYYCMVHI